MSIYLKKDELKDAYFEAEKVSEDWFKPFDEYERLAANKLSKTIAKHMPRVNDGSLAASLLETPMNVLPVMQPGKFQARNHKEAWVNEVANIIWRTRIVPNANTQASFFDKEQIALYRALKYGAQPRYNFFVSTENYTGSDWSLPYIRNVKLEPGKTSVEDCDYVFLDVYYTKLQLKRIIQDQKKEAKKAKEEGRKPDTSWNPKLLQKLVDMAKTEKELKEQNLPERERQIKASGIKTTVIFQRGIGAPFYMFSPFLEAGDCIREWKNPDPTGDLPITMQYCYENLEGPYGIGRVELAGPTQNVLDYMTQAHVLATQVGISPPKKIRGPLESVNLNSITFTPDARWLMGAGGADVEVMQTTNSVYTQFPNNFGLYKSQLQTLQGRTDASVSASSGNPTFSKTSAGVAMQQERTNAQDNYLRNKADTASAKMATKMMNVHMAKMEGADVLDVVQDDVERLKKSGFFDEDPNTPAPSVNEIEILYEDLKDTFTFEFDPRPEADDADKNRWIELIDIATSNPNVIPAIQASGYDFSLGEAFKKVISASGADGWDKVLVELDPEQQQMMGQEQMMAEMAQNPELAGNPTSPEAPQGPQIDPDELDATMELYQIDEAAAMAVIEARQKGFDEEEIAAFLQGKKGE